jgi:uncharacterized membrane protein
MTGNIVARALHVLFVVIWIGGVFMVTAVILPAIRRGDLGPDRLRAFQAIENRFVGFARLSVIVVGATGLYMIVQDDLWSRFHDAQFWWMHAMVCLWLIFAVILFVAEPFVLHRRLPAMAEANRDRVFGRLNRGHWLLLVLSLITVFGAVAGSHGWPIF